VEHWDVPGARPTGALRSAVRRDEYRATWFAADKTGFHMLHTLFQTSLKYANVKRYDEWMTTSLLVEDGVAKRDRDRAPHRAGTRHPGKAVILCTGGFGRVFHSPRTRRSAQATGSASRSARGALKDLEFVQYHPTGCLARHSDHRGARGEAASCSTKTATATSRTTTR